MSERKSGENHPMHGKTHTPETKALMSERNSGENNHFFGKTHTTESIDHNRINQPNRKSVYVYDMDSKLVGKFLSQSEASSDPPPSSARFLAPPQRRAAIAMHLLRVALRDRGYKKIETCHNDQFKFVKFKLIIVSRVRGKIPGLGPLYGGPLPCRDKKKMIKIIFLFKGYKKK